MLFGPWSNLLQVQSGGSFDGTIAPFSDLPTLS